MALTSARWTARPTRCEGVRVGRMPWRETRRRKASTPRPRHVAAMVFTGIVQGTAEVERVTGVDDFRTMTLRFPAKATDGAQIGGSVALNGTCLTIVDQKEDLMTFDVIEETLQKTNLGELEQGHYVNFERAARFGDEIGGHCVSGHVHAKGVITEKEMTDSNARYSVQLPRGWIKYVMPKGFIAVDGCSLTVGEVGEDTFNLYLIPETLRVTTLGGKGPGDSVNIEIDGQTQAIVDTIEKYLELNLDTKIKNMY